MYIKIFLCLFSLIFFAGCNSPFIQEMYHGKSRGSGRSKASSAMKPEKYRSESNVDAMTETEINSRERDYLRMQHREMDSTRDARRARVFGGWSPVKKRD